MEMDLNDGLFTQNGRSGYVLKPEILRNRERAFDPEKPEEREDYHPLLFSVKVLNSICIPSTNSVWDYICWLFFHFLKVISGQQLPKVKQKEWSIVDPLVRVEIHGVPLDQAKQETKYIDNNGEEVNVNMKWSEVLPNQIRNLL